MFHNSNKLTTVLSDGYSMLGKIMSPSLEEVKIGKKDADVEEVHYAILGDVKLPTAVRKVFTGSRETNMLLFNVAYAVLANAELPTTKSDVISAARDLRTFARRNPKSWIIDQHSPTETSLIMLANRDGSATGEERPAKRVKHADSAGEQYVRCCKQVRRAFGASFSQEQAKMLFLELLAQVRSDTSIKSNRDDKQVGVTEAQCVAFIAGKVASAAK